MCAYRVEIAENGRIQFAVCMCLVTDDLLVNLLGIAVRRECFLYRRCFIYRQMVVVRLTIDGAGRGKDEIIDLMQLHHFEQCTETAKIVAVIKERFFHRFTNGFAGSKMNNTHNVRIGLEDTVQIDKISAIDIGEIRLASYNSSDTFQDINRRIAEIIDNGHLIALLHEFNGCMRAYIASSACYKYSGHN